MRRKQILIALAIVTIMISLSVGYAVTHSEKPPQDDASYAAFQEATTQSFGSVSGVVLDNDGNPVAGAKVTADKVPVMKQLELRADTDEQGRFIFSSLEPGTYELYANKEEDGYLPTYTAFHTVGLAIRPTPLIEVQAGQTTPNITVRVGPKAAKLVGAVVDQETKKAVKQAQTTLRRADDPDSFYTTGLVKQGGGVDQPGEPGEFEVLVPPASFTIEVSAPGYKKWHYKRNGLNNSSASKYGDDLQVSSSNAKVLTITLTPDY